MACSISLGSAFNCGELAQGGIKPFVILFNLEDYKAATKTYDADGAIDTFVNATGLQGYKYEAADETNIIPLEEPRAVEGGADTWKHGMTLPVWDLSQAMRNNIEAMQKAPVVAVVMLNAGIGRVYGKDGGMKLTSQTDNPQDPNLGNMIQLVLETKDTQPGETKKPLNINAGDEITTLALIEGMTVVGA